MSSTLLRSLALPLLIAASAALPAQAPEPEDLEFRDGVAKIPDRATYERLSYQGNAGRDAYLNGIQFVKFILVGAGGKQQKLYFMNTKTRQAHPMFMRDVGLGGAFGGRGGRRRGGRERGGGEERGAQAAGRTMRGAISYRPLVEAPDGTPGTYAFDFQPNDSFPLELLKTCYDALLAKAPFLKGKLVYHPLRGGLRDYERRKDAFKNGKLPTYVDEVFDKSIVFLPMNPGRSFGRLRNVSLDELPTARDIVLYEALPNELPRVAGMITGVRQTPLSHVNLRAIQDKVPNAFVAGAAQDSRVRALVGKYVCYTVRKDGYSIREASSEEVEAHFKTLRPAAIQTPKLDLSVKDLKKLDAISFGDAPAFGVKTTNLAALRKLRPSGVHVPDGFGLPFHFYAAFMKHNGLEAKVETVLAGKGDHKVALADLRKAIVAGETPDWMNDVLGEVQKSFGEGAFIRCRSSTNNEDLPGFSGAGLYASCTHDPGAGPLARSVKEVFASLWTERAFEERVFYRVDQRKTAMGVLIHESFKEERANGVAVTLDILYRRDGFNYVNCQVGEDMVTNPDALSIPEELLIPWRSGAARLMQSSNRVKTDERVLGTAHEQTLKKALEAIHDGFARHYGKRASDKKFAMEIEFKITKDDKLAIKQARPWIFTPEPPREKKR